jgi:hypothetical protein
MTIPCVPFSTEMELAFMADNTTTTAEASQPEPLSLKAFAASL